MTTRLQSTATPETGFRGLGIRLFEEWTAMWNGDLALADRIVTDGFRIHFASNTPGTDSFRGPADLTRFVAAHRADKPGLVYRLHGTPVVDTETGQVTWRWSASRPDGAGGTVAVSGIDVLAVSGERITDVWSIGGDRVFGCDS